MPELFLLRHRAADLGQQLHQAQGIGPRDGAGIELLLLAY